MGPQLSLRTKSLAALWGIDYKKEERWQARERVPERQSSEEGTRRMCPQAKEQRQKEGIDFRNSSEVT